MQENTEEVYEFLDFRFDLTERMVWRKQELVNLPPKAIELMILLVQRAPAIVPRADILDTVWPNTFVEDGNINYTVSQIRKTLGVKEIIQTVPRRGYRFGAEIRRVNAQPVPAHVEQPATTDFTLTDRKSEAKRFPKKPIAVSMIALVLLLLGGFVINSTWRTANEPGFTAIRNIKTIAVVPFTDQNAPPSQSGRSYMVTSAIIERLSPVDGIIVRPLEAVEKLNGEDPLKAGATLAADAVISGTILSGDGVTTVELTISDVRNGSVILSERLETADAETDDFHSQLALRIASSLLIRLKDSERITLGKRITANPEAYRLYMEGRALFERPSPGAYEQILDRYNRATFLDPTFAAAYCGLADLFFRRGTSAEGPASMELYRRAEGFAKRALELDPQLPQAHAAIGRSHRAIRRDFTAAEESFRRALELNPNHLQSLGFLGQLYVLRGQHAEAIAIAERALEIDPRAHSAIFLRFRGYEATRDYQMGLETASAAFNLDRQVHYARVALATFLFYTGDYEQMRLIANEGFEQSKGFVFIWHQLLARAALKSGDLANAEIHLKPLEEGATTSTKYLYRLAVIYAEQGKTDEAFAALEKCFENHETWMVWMNTEPGFDNIRSDPRFHDLLTKMNLKN